MINSSALFSSPDLSCYKVHYSIPLIMSVVPTPVDLSDVQGDIILKFPKLVENFIFFTIAQGAAFRKVVGSQAFMALITSAANVKGFRQQISAQKAKFRGKTVPLLPNSAVNIAFTQPGLNLLGLKDNLGDPAFTDGQFQRAHQLGDNVPDWLPAFKGDVHGVILISGDSEASMLATEAKLLLLLGPTITQVFKVNGVVRPGTEHGHEHFGYKDGISSPAVKGIHNDPFPGQQVCDPGVLLMGQPGDTSAATRPVWAKNGSILVYRHLDQLVPEFDKFKHDNPLFPLELGIEKGAELFGARMFGRWKSGAPTDLAPTQDDTELAKEPTRNNNFDFSDPTDQSHCPFAAHIRKTNPRSDLANDIVARHSINRNGIPFGPEVSPLERQNNKTTLERGLAFVCYQSSLSNGFEFMQKAWANDPNFIFGKTDTDGNPITPGFDPIIGQKNGEARQTGGLDPKEQGANTSFPTQFVISKGGAYFFSPSLSVLRTRIGTA
ncbi:Dyp-type peroxidase [Gautieria morchelliformis]|nr:Dyp-type peroxidase [Gautieria morchelliformis]